MQRLNNIAICGTFFLLSACGNPGGISDADYAEYKQLGAPKILYSCSKTEEITATADCLFYQKKSNPIEECMKLSNPEKLVKHTEIKVGYAAGVGMNATYNKLLSDAKAGCENEFAVLESKQ